MAAGNFAEGGTTSPSGNLLRWDSHPSRHRHAGLAFAGVVDAGDGDFHGLAGGQGFEDVLVVFGVEDFHGVGVGPTIFW